MLGALPYDLLKRISGAVRIEQSKKFPVTRSSFFVDRATARYGDWLRLQDIPQWIVRSRSNKDRSEAARRGSIPDTPPPAPLSRNVSEDIFTMDGVSSSPPAPTGSSTIKGPLSKQPSGWKAIGPVIKYGPLHYPVTRVAEGVFRHDMKTIIAETERSAFPHTPPKDGLSTVKWTPRTPPRSERMPLTSGPPLSSSVSKRIDLRMTPAITPVSSTIHGFNTTGSGLSLTRPQGVNPTFGAVKPQSQSPPKSLSKPPNHIPPSLTRTQSTQVTQPIIPIKMGASSPSVRRTS